MSPLNHRPLTALVTGATDLSDPAAIKDLAQQVGDIDVLVNNAGHSVWGPTGDMSVADFDSMFASNVRAAYLLVGAFAPAMAQRGAGSVINISSMAGALASMAVQPTGRPKPRLLRWRKAGPPSTARAGCA